MKLHVKKLHPLTAASNQFTFDLILGHDLEVRITRKWLPDRIYRSAKLFRWKKPRGWRIEILQNFDSLPSRRDVGCGVHEAWVRAQEGTKGEAGVQDLSESHGEQVLQLADLR
jgi:hypothetical protein